MKTNKTDLILHPVRLRVLRALANRQLSTAELQNELGDIPVASLYRHISKLLDGGVIKVCDERIIKGTIERVFSLPDSSNLIGDRVLKKASHEDHFRFFSTFVATLLKDYENYLQAGKADLQKDGVGYRTAQLYLTDAELSEMSKDLQKVLLPYLKFQPKRGRIARNFSTILIPKKTRRKK